MDHYTSIYMRDYIPYDKLASCEAKPLTSGEGSDHTKAPGGTSPCSRGDVWDVPKFTTTVKPIDLCGIEPNRFLQKLKEKYPYIYETLKNAPMNDLAQRIKKEISRSTYQVDICHLTEYASAPYSELLRAEKYQGAGPCQPPIILPGDVRRPNQRQRIIRPSATGSRGIGDRQTKKTVPLTPGLTEYQEVVSKLGAQIIRDQIHGNPDAEDVAEPQPKLQLPC